MRILVVTNLYPSAAHPEFGTFVAARVDALRSSGAQVDVVANVDAAVHRRRGVKYASLLVRTARYCTMSFLRRRRVDVVEAHIAFPTGLIAWPAARALGAPLVLFAHGADVTRVSSASGPARFLAAATFRAAAMIIANSRFLAGEVGRRFPAAAGRTIVLSPGIEFSRFAEPRPGPDSTATRTGVLFVGRLVPEKGADRLIHAIARLESGDRPPLTIIGDGPDREALLSLARERGVQAEFDGPLDRDAVAQSMRRAAVVVVPSVYEEPLGLVALEGMAAGALVVASSAGGLTEIVDDGRTGFLVPPGDVDALAACLRRALAMSEDPIAGSAMRETARATALRHDVATIASESLALYDTLTG